MSATDNRNDLENEEIEDRPLTKHVFSVTRINRKAVAVLLSLVAGLAIISVLWAVSPGKKEDQPVQDVARKDTPNLPEGIEDSPGDYQVLAKNKDVPRLGPPPDEDLRKELEAGRALMQAGSDGGTPSYITYPADLKLDPTRETSKRESDRRRKEYQEAVRSPISFGGGAGFMPSRAPASIQDALPASTSILPPSPPPGIGNLDALTKNIKIPGMGEDDQNMQDEKREFSDKQRKVQAYLETPLMKPISRFEIKAGTIIPSLLITGLNSDLPGQIVAQVRENVYDTVSGRFLLIPQGTRLVGEYDSKVAYGQERALIVWSRLIMPNGNSIILEGMPGVDLSGYAGIRDRINNHYVKLLTGVILGSVIGAGAQVATGGQGTAINAPSFGQLAVSGAAQNINQAGQQITNKNLNMQPTIEVRPGMKLNVFVTRDMILQPYKM